MDATSIFCFASIAALFGAFFMDVFFRFNRINKELTDLKHSYREAIDGKLAAEREVEGMKAKINEVQHYFKGFGE